MKLKSYGASITALALLAGTLSAGDDSAAELKRLEGRFERYATNAGGVRFRTVRDVVGDQSTVSTFDDVGNLVESHTSTIKVEKRGPVRVLSFFNLLVTAGPNKGHTQLGTSTYIYRLEGDVFTEAWGFLEGDSSPPRVFEWQRVKAK